MSGEAWGRLRWHSRRGMLELDLLLERFWEQFGDNLSAGDRDGLEWLLEREDNELLQLILGEASCPGQASHVLGMLRES